MLIELPSLINSSQQKQKVKKLRITKEIAQIADEMVKAEGSLKEFVIQAWHVVEPKTPFVDGYHIDVICEHLEAVFSLEIQNLLINMPPRHMKSLIVSVFFPCWVWMKDPYSKWLYSSYIQSLSTRDSLKCRRLIQSLWYQSRWGDSFYITTDQNQKMRFENNKTGYRIATSVDGASTGEGGDYVVVDDPHNVKEGESEAKREDVLKWWDEVMSTRINNPATGRFIIVMQRVHAKDLTGHILGGDSSEDYVHLCLPARYERNRKPKIEMTPIGFEDPRRVDGEVLWQGMYPNKRLKKLERVLGIYAAAGQLQQRPSPREGGMFKVTDFKLIDHMPPVVRGIRYWDKAGTEPKKDGRKDKSKYTAGLLMYIMSNGGFLIADVIRGRWEAPEREKRIKMGAQKDGVEVTVWIEQEGGSGGKESAQSTKKNMVGFGIWAERPTGSKEIRAEPYSAQVEAGNVYILNDGTTKKWVQPFLDEHELFPMSEFKDQVDAASGAFNKLNFASRAGVI